VVRGGEGPWHQGLPKVEAIKLHAPVGTCGGGGGSLLGSALQQGHTPTRISSSRGSSKKRDQPRTASLLLRRTAAVGGTAVGAWGAAEACVSKLGMCVRSRVIASRFRCATTGS
jgi:hypothetical protein